jgi:hypothetical protein
MPRVSTVVSSRPSTMRPSLRNCMQLLTRYHHRNIPLLVAHSNNGYRPCLVYETRQQFVSLWLQEKLNVSSLHPKCHSPRRSEYVLHIAAMHSGVKLLNVSKHCSHYSPTSSPSFSTGRTLGSHQRASIKVLIQWQTDSHWFTLQVLFLVLYLTHHDVTRNIEIVVIHYTISYLQLKNKLKYKVLLLVWGTVTS